MNARCKKGFTLFFTGLSGAGKSTTANLLMRQLDRAGRSVTLLDGDMVRRDLSPELGFSRADRDLHIRRIGFVASEITRHGGACICANIAPYHASRAEVRAMIEPHGGFVLIHVSTPLSVCEARDTKGLYAKARSGTLSDFTGVSAPYELPLDAEITIDMSLTSPDESAELIVTFLEASGYL